MAENNSSPFRHAFGDLLASLRSPDKPTRRAAVLFFLSLSAAIGIGWYGFHRWMYPHGSVDDAAESEFGENLDDFLEKTAMEAKWKNTTLGLGDFVIDLKRPDPGPAPARKIRGVMNMANIELFVECDTQDTCDFIEGSSAQARSHITNALIQVDRDDLLSREGKRKIKKAVIDRLNSWLPKGKIENVYISKLIIS